MSWTHVHFTLRKWYRLLRAPAFLTVLGAMTLLISAYQVPAGADLPGIIAVVLRQAVLSVLSAAVATFFILLWSGMLEQRGMTPVLRYGLAGLGASPPVALVVLVIEASRGEPVLSADYLTGMVLNVVVTVTAISVIVGVLLRQGRQVAGPAPEAGATATEGAQEAIAGPAAGAAFLKRLPPELGQEVMRLSATDHYVEVQTPLGSTLVLMRFSDALEEIAGLEGLQIHRSHWVARGAMRRLLRQDRALLVELSDGSRWPVSRSQQPSVRALGLPVANG